MLITLPPQARYMWLSARVENCGPSTLRQQSELVDGGFRGEEETDNGIHTHANDRAPVVQNDPVTLQAMSTLAHHLGDALVKGVGKGDVGNHAALEVRPWPHALGTVNDLVWNDEVAWLDCLLETADSREGDDAPHADGAQGGNVWAGRDLVRGELVVRAVAAQECDGDGLVIVLALVVQDGDWRGGLAPGC